MAGLTIVRVVFAPPHRRKRSVTTFTPTWTALVAQAQAVPTSLTPLPAQFLTATANHSVTPIPMAVTAIFWELRHGSLKPIICRHRREEILNQAKLRPATATTAHFQWTSFVAA